MADVARVRADIKARLMSEDWRQQFLTVAVIKSAVDDLTAEDGEIIRNDMLRRLDLDLGRFLRKKAEEKLSIIADGQIDVALADNQLSLDEYEKLI